MGLDSTTVLTKDLANLDVRLCYRMGSFTDKQYLKIYAEKSSPNSLNSGLLLPDESYNILIYKNQPFERVVFSSVILQVVEDGYAIYGYSITNPYFEILASKTAGTKIEISAGGTTVRVPNQYSNDVIQVPYGYVFTNSTAVVDFLLSYGALLTSQGLVFGDRENGHQLDWNQMAQEFLYWSAQGWDLGSVINLNPCAFSLTAVRDQAIVDSILAQTPENLLLDQNRTNLPVRDLVVDRQGNRFTVTSLSQQTISYLDLKYTSYESMVILDNVSLFNDLIYSPVTGARQSRVNIAATVSADWNGQLDAQGFIYNNPRTIKQWQPSQKYAKGEIVTFKNVYWSAQDIVQPSIEFDVSKWVKSDYNKIQKGMLQNIPSKANQLANSYNTNQANLETDQDLVAYGLLGFRPRQYMAALNLDDISQVNVYQQFLKTKGTLESVKLIGNASFSGTNYYRGLNYFSGITNFNSGVSFNSGNIIFSGTGQAFATKTTFSGDVALLGNTTGASLQVTSSLGISTSASFTNNGQSFFYNDVYVSGVGNDLILRANSLQLSDADVAQLSGVSDYNESYINLNSGSFLEIKSGSKETLYKDSNFTIKSGAKFNIETGIHTQNDGSIPASATWLQGSATMKSAVVAGPEKMNVRKYIRSYSQGNAATSQG